MMHSVPIDEEQKTAGALLALPLLLFLTSASLIAQEEPSEFKIKPPEDIGYMKVPVRIMDRTTFEAYSLEHGGDATAIISYTVSRAGRVRIRLVDRERREILLRTIRDWTDSKFGSRYESQWDGLDASGNWVPRTRRYFSFEGADEWQGGIHQHHEISMCHDFHVEMVAFEIGTEVEGSVPVRMTLRTDGSAMSTGDPCRIRVFFERKLVKVASCITDSDGFLETDLFLSAAPSRSGLMVVNIDDSRDHVGVATRRLGLHEPEALTAMPQR